MVCKLGNYPSILLHWTDSAGRFKNTATIAIIVSVVDTIPAAGHLATACVKHTEKEPLQFAVAAPRIRNIIPRNIRTSNSTDI